LNHYQLCSAGRCSSLHLVTN